MPKAEASIGMTKRATSWPTVSGGSSGFSSDLPPTEPPVWDTVIRPPATNPCPASTSRTLIVTGVSIHVDLLTPVGSQMPGPTSWAGPAELTTPRINAVLAPASSSNDEYKGYSMRVREGTKSHCSEDGVAVALLPSIRSAVPQPPVKPTSNATEEPKAKSGRFTASPRQRLCHSM